MNAAAAWVEVERLQARVAELEREREGCDDPRGRVMDYLSPAWVDGYKTATAECLTRIAELECERDGLRAAGDKLADALDEAAEGWPRPNRYDMALAGWREVCGG